MSPITKRQSRAATRNEAKRARRAVIGWRGVICLATVPIWQGKWCACDSLCLGGPPCSLHSLYSGYVSPLQHSVAPLPCHTLQAGIPCYGCGTQRNDAPGTSTCQRPHKHRQGLGASPNGYSGVRPAEARPPAHLQLLCSCSCFCPPIFQLAAQRTRQHRLWRRSLTNQRQGCLWRSLAVGSRYRFATRLTVLYPIFITGSTERVSAHLGYTKRNSTSPTSATCGAAQSLNCVWAVPNPTFCTGTRRNLVTVAPYTRCPTPALRHW